MRASLGGSTRLLPAILSSWLTLLLPHIACSEPQKYDLLLSGGLVIDGSGQAPRRADVGIRNSRVAALGDLGGAESVRRIDVSGLVVAPGFVDVHSHADEDMNRPQYRAAPGMIRQGVTTAVFGVDGAYGLEALRALRGDLETNGAGVNYLYFVGHNGVRKEVMGAATGAPSSAELQAMRAQIHAAMVEGAVGLSTGLMYLPARYATTQEVVELATVVAPFGGRYDAHDRDPAFNLLQSVAESLEIARRAGIAAHVAHLKAVGRRNAQLTPDLIRMIEAARSAGETVTADVYPYDGATTRLIPEILVAPPSSAIDRNQALLADVSADEAARATALTKLVADLRAALRDPRQRALLRSLTENPPEGQYSWVQAVGYESFRIVSAPRAEQVDKLVVDLAAERSVTPFDLLAQLILEEGASVRLTMGTIREQDVRALLTRPWVMISSDGREGGIAAGRGHPRYRGSFARVLAHYVRDQRLLTLQDAVHRMTSLPAAYLKLRDRGLLCEGAWADIAVFDPLRVQDHATWDDPAAYATGVEYVLVNGRLALDRGEPTGELAGRYLRFTQ